MKKIGKMKSALRKQDIIINEDVKENETEPNEQKPAEPTVKFYGKEALAAVQDRIWIDMIIYFRVCFILFFNLSTIQGTGKQKSRLGEAKWKFFKKSQFTGSHIKFQILQGVP